MSRFTPTLGLAAALALALVQPSFARGATKTGYLLPAPSAADVAVGTDGYRIGPLDKLDVNVFQVKDLTGTVDVDSAGEISLPLVGELHAGGRTPDAVAKDIAGKLRGTYVKDPQVTVTVKESLSQKATVGGAVSKPGVYPLPGHTTLSSVVALAGGPDPEHANAREVRLIRIVNGQRMQATYNLAAIEKGSAEDPEVYGNDTVIVGVSGSKAMMKNFGILSPLIYLLRPF